MWMFLLSCLVSMEVDEKATVVSFENKSLPSCKQNFFSGTQSSIRIGFEIPEQFSGWGSGNYFKMGKYKFIVTAAHVVDQGNVFVLDGEKKISAKVLYKNTLRDIAIVSVDEPLSIRPRKLKVNDNPNIVGEMINYTGYPSNLGKSTFTGIVSKSDKRAVMAQSFALPGSSGSVVFDKKGRAIGVVSAVKISSSPLSPFPEIVETIVFIERVGFLNKGFLREVFMDGHRGE
jgi:S1-C subfamily serine protease